jgi:hypothetical protein
MIGTRSFELRRGASMVRCAATSGLSRVVVREPGVRRPVSPELIPFVSLAVTTICVLEGGIAVSGETGRPGLAVLSRNSAKEFSRDSRRLNSRAVVPTDVSSISGAVARARWLALLRALDSWAMSISLSFRKPSVGGAHLAMKLPVFGVQLQWSSHDGQL